MRSTKTIHIVSCHAEGEGGDVIVGGVAPPPGNSLWEQRNFIARDRNLRDFVLLEPRGGVFRHVNLLVPPKHPDANAANKQLGFTHPENPDWKHISFCLFAGPLSSTSTGFTAKSAVAIQPGKVDRSPTGTAVSARMAILSAQQKMSVGQELVATSIIGSQFSGTIVREAVVGGQPAIVPSVSGRGWITGTHQHMLDPSDPWPTGYKLSDTWGAR